MNKLHGLGVLGLCAIVAVASCSEEPAKPAQVSAQPSAQPSAPPPPAISQEPPHATAPAEQPAPQPPAPEVAPARPSYTVRGEIVALPGIEGTVLQLHHERIPTFANREGKIANDSKGKPGMKPMTMGFSRAQDVSFEGLKKGDKIEVDFFVNWEQLGKDDNIVITRLVKLAPESKLDFEGQPSVSDPKPVKPEPK